MSEKIVGVVKDISQFIVGIVVAETDEVLTLRNAALLGISNQGSQINIQFIPLDLLSLQPPLGVKHLVKDPSLPLDVELQKKSLLYSNLELNDNVIGNYKNFIGQNVPAVPQSSAPDQNIVKLF